MSTSSNCWFLNSSFLTKNVGELVQIIDQRTQQRLAGLTVDEFVELLQRYVGGATARRPLTPRFCTQVRCLVIIQRSKNTENGKTEFSCVEYQTKPSSSMNNI